MINRLDSTNYNTLDQTNYYYHKLQIQFGNIESSILPYNPFQFLYLNSYYMWSFKYTGIIFKEKQEKMKDRILTYHPKKLVNFKKVNLQTISYNSMQDTYSISIVIPTLNEENHIEKCLSSVFNQTYYSNITEIFVVDGGSIDRTVEIVNRLCLDHTNLFLLHNNKIIQAAAFNIAIDNFKGDLLIRLDAHCTYDSEYIHYCVRYHASFDYGNVGGRCIIEPDSGSNMAKVIALANASRFGLGFAAYRVGEKIMFTDSVPFGSFTKKVLSDVGKMDESLPRGEDNEYNARIREKGYKILFDPKIVSYYYSPAKLKLFLKKMYANGFSIGVLLRVSKKSINLRHLVPLTFVVALIAGVSLSFVHVLFKFALLLLILIYLILIITSVMPKFLKDEIKLIPIYIFVVLFVHIFYGIGTIVGLIKGKYFI